MRRGSRPSRSGPAAAAAARSRAARPCPSPSPAPAARSRTPAPSARNVCSETATPSTGAAPCNRDAVLTTSPVTIPSPSSGRAPERHHRLARVDPDPHLQRQARDPAAFSSSIASKIRNPALTARSASSSCATGAPNTAITASPDELLHRPAVALELRAQPRVVRPDPRPHILRVRLLRGGRETDQVTEQDRDDLPLLLNRTPAAAVSGAAQNGQNGNSPPGAPCRRQGRPPPAESRPQSYLCQRRAETPTEPLVFGSTIMELAGLEPPTSWVRSRRSPN